MTVAQRDGIGGRLDIVHAVQQLAMATTVNEIQDIVRQAARRLTGADGATFVLRDDDRSYYVAEDAIAPLWKGQKFPLNTCISGWAMLHAQAVAIPDINVDDRIPLDAYRPTFVKSLVMVPIGTMSPIGAIGNYWATEHHVTEVELATLQALADSTAVAMENVTVRDELEQRVADRTAKLEAATAAQEQLIRHLAHEVRGPLYAGDGLLELLVVESDRGDLPDGVLKDLVSVRGTIAEALRVVDEELEAARLRTGRMRAPRREPLDLHEVLNELRDSFRALASAAGVSLVVDADPQLQPILTDRYFLGQILRNLVTNAAKFTDHGEIAVDAVPEGPGLVRITVTDTGIGIAPLELERIFEEFAQIDRAQLSRRIGTGLGLPLVKRLVTALGGSIAVSSRLGSGSRFTILLPVE